MDRANLEAGRASTTISSLASDCTSGFLLLVANSNYRELDAIDDAHGRFNVWAANLGALQPSKSLKSLDSRLIDAKLMRASVVSGLERLLSVQTRITRILAGEQQNRRQTEGEFEEINSETSELVLDELHELLLNMKTSIDHLFGLSILIRRLRPKGKIGEISSFQPSPDHHRDTVTVIDKFPKTKQALWLAERLGSANDQRRQFFAYRQQHRGQLNIKSKRQEVLSGNDDVTLRAATTVATTFEDGDGGPSETRDNELDRRSVITTATSFVSDFDDRGQMGRHVPELPDMTLDGVQLGYEELIECPYCRTIQSFTDRLTWKKHVFSDLQPYICTFENCSVAPFSTRNDWFQHELDNHRRRWECILCDNPRPTFSDRAQIATHFKNHHEGNVTENQTDLIIGACEAPVTNFEASSCSLCSEWVPPLEEAINLREFRRHLARHLQQISLEALPIYIEGLVIQENVNQDDDVVYKKGIALFDSRRFIDSTGPSFAKGDEVLILSNKFDEYLWQVRVMKNGQEGLIPGEAISITGAISMPLGIPKPDPSKMRKWTTRSGLFSVLAQFVGVEDENIILHKLGGIKIKVPREKLSLHDLAYVETIIERDFESEGDTDPSIPELEERPPEDTSACQRSNEEGYWIAQHTPDGRLFFYNAVTGESVSELPLESSSSAAEAGPQDQMNANIPDTMMQAEKSKPHVDTPLHTAVSARIVSYGFADDEGWFIVQVLLEDGQTWELTRFFKDVQDLHVGLLAEFPSEARSLRYRTLTQDPVGVVTEADTIRRLPELNAYLKDLLGQPPRMSNCGAVKRFFAPRDGDDKINPVDWSERYTDGLYQHRTSRGSD